MKFEMPIRTLVRTAVALLVMVLLAMIFSSADIHSVVRYALSTGVLAAPILLLYLLGCIFDTLAWRTLFIRTQRKRIPFLLLLGIHIAGESFYRFAPAGAVIGESVKTALLRSRTNADVPEIISSLVLRKVFMGMAQGVYIATAVTIGIVWGDAVDFTVVAVGLGTAAVLSIIFIIAGTLIVRGRIGAVLKGWLLRIPVVRIRRWVLQNGASFEELDTLLSSSRDSSRPVLAGATGLFLLGWLTEMAETMVILWGVAPGISASGVLMFEPVVSALRSVAFIFPGGLGVTEAGYAATIVAARIEDAASVTAAFMVIKRAKEMVWIVIGVGLAAVMRGNSTVPSPSGVIIKEAV